MFAIRVDAIAPHRHRSSHAVATALALVLVLIVSPTFGTQWSGQGGPALASVAPDSASIRASSYVPGNFSYCAPFGASPAAIANLPNYTANVSAIWSDLCNRSAYVAVINEWGGVGLVNSGNNTSYWIAGNLSIQVGGVIGGIPTISFVVQWGAPCDNVSLGPANAQCSYQEYWTGNLSTDRLSGPFNSERGEVRTTGPVASHSPFGWLAVAVAVGAVCFLGVAVVLYGRRPPRGPSSKSPASVLRPIAGRSPPAPRPTPEGPGARQPAYQTAEPAGGVLGPTRVPDPVDDLF